MVAATAAAFVVVAVVVGNPIFRFPFAKHELRLSIGSFQYAYENKLISRFRVT